MHSEGGRDEVDAGIEAGSLQLRGFGMGTNASSGDLDISLRALCLSASCSSLPALIATLRSIAF